MILGFKLSKLDANILIEKDYHNHILYYLLGYK